MHFSTYGILAHTVSLCAYCIFLSRIIPYELSVRYPYTLTTRTPSMLFILPGSLLLDFILMMGDWPETLILQYSNTMIFKVPQR